MVTARRRDESATEVSIALTIVRQQQLERYGLDDSTDLGQRVPNFYLSTHGTAGVPRMSIRGFGTSTVSPYAVQAVGLSIDGVYCGRPDLWNPRLFEASRVEVLRGEPDQRF